LKLLPVARKANNSEKLSGKKILINAGPTHEKIDPVRFIGNYSTGKMGYALAEACAAEGAEVFLVSGPVSLSPIHANIKRYMVTSAAEMANRCFTLYKKCDAGILTAAVADYTPVQKSDQKIKRTKNSWTIELEPTTDIAAELGRSKKRGQVLVGFALETTDELENAKGKLLRKNFDFIVLNSLNDKGAGFGFDTNKVSILERDNNIRIFELKTKKEVALDIIDKLLEYVPK
jgi:phosphopantothenoylcysteine decarboxylase/phosphopantothenate--cysteine ligase